MSNTNSNGLANPTAKVSYSPYNVLDRFKNAGKAGYTSTGALDWNYRNGYGPSVSVEGTENWSAKDWQDFGAKGGTISDSATLQYPGTSGSGNWFGKDGYLANGAQIVGALSGLAGAYTGYKNYQLAQDQFDAEQKYAAANLYNQGTLVNNQIKNAAEVGQALAGDTMTADQKAAQLTGLASKYVKTAV